MYRHLSRKITKLYPCFMLLRQVSREDPSTLSPDPRYGQSTLFEQTTPSVTELVDTNASVSGAPLTRGSNVLSISPAVQQPKESLSTDTRSVLTASFAGTDFTDLDLDDQQLGGRVAWVLPENLNQAGNCSSRPLCAGFRQASGRLQVRS